MLLISPAPTAIVSRSSAPTQSGYDTHAATRGSDLGTLSTGTALLSTVFSGSGTYRFTLDFTHSGIMYGSPYGHDATNDSTVGQFVNHCVESATMFDQLGGASQSKVILVLTEQSSTDTNTAVNRNGYTNSTFGSAFDCYRCTEVTYWDTVLERATTANPYTESAYTEYTW